MNVLNGVPGPAKKAGKRRGGRDFSGDCIRPGRAKEDQMAWRWWLGSSLLLMPFLSTFLLLLLIGPSPRSRTDDGRPEDRGETFNWSMAAEWSPFPGSPTVEISNGQSSVSCRLPLLESVLCQTTNPKTPARRSLVGGQEKDLGQRVLEGFDPCFHATAGISSRCC